MTTVFSWAGDGLSAGALTTSSAGTGDGTWDEVNGSLTISATGVRPPRIYMPLSSSVSRVRKYLTPQTSTGISFYMNWESFAGSTVALIVGQQNSHVDQSWRIEKRSTGELRLRNAANTQVGSDSAGALSPATDYRMALTIDSGGNLVCNAFIGESATIAATVSGAVDATVDAIRIGDAYTVTNEPGHYIDNVVFTNTAVDPGPVPAPQRMVFSYFVHQG